MSKCLYSGAKLIWLTSWSLMLLADSPGYFCAQFGSGHKSEAQIARMTPEQRVEEYCRESLRHRHDLDDNYWDLLHTYVSRDGIKAVPQLVKIIDEYNPTQPNSRSRERYDRCDAAWGLLDHLDKNVVRLRGSPSEQGRKGIEAMRRLVDRMRAGHFDTATGDEYAKQLRYQATLATVEHMEGINWCDESIRDTLKLRYKISLSDKESLDFTNYMISQDPYYPGWSERELYKDRGDVNETGNPRQYVIVRTAEPFYNAYLHYKAKTK